MKMKRVFISALVVFLIIFATSLLVPYGEDGKRKLASYDYSQVEANIRKNKEQIILDLGDNKGLEYKQSFNVVEAGEYYIEAKYLPKEGKGRDIEFNIHIDGVNIAKESGISSLSRFFISSPDFKRTLTGDEVRPEQSEIFVRGKEAFRDNSKSLIKVFLEAGEHSLEIINIKEECEMDSIYLSLIKNRTYKEYVEGLPDKKEDSHYMNHIEAETPYLKSVADIYPIYDRSSPYTTPYNPTDLRYNAIGGQNWSDAGQWIDWVIDVPKDDYYQIGLRYRQNLNKGVESLRRIEVDGEVLFDELEEVGFDYSVNWQQKFIGDDEPFLFYLTEGQHRIRMEVSLGGLSEIISQMNDTVYDLNALYREIIMITGTVPDIYRDYNLDVAIPDLVENLNSVKDQLTSYEDYLSNRYGEGNYSSRVISQLARQIERFINKPYIIQKSLSVFKTNISATAEWVLSFEEQPLEVDSFYITGVGMGLPKVETNFLGKMGHEIRSFTGSFFRDYSNVGATNQDKDLPTITVWVNKGRDQANVIKRLIDDNFTKETGIGVNISLVQGALVKAAISGKGPDVNLFTTRGEAMNLAFRGALLPLDELNGFDKMTEDYMDNAFVPYEYDDKSYAIPEEQIFYTMFVRTDILSSLSIDYPETWDDLMKIMPVLQGANLEIGLPYTDGYATMNSGVGTINLLPTILAQRGIGIYNEDNTKVMLDSSEAYEAFKMWSDFYTMYDFPLYKDDFNRFRTGEMPIIIAPYTLYNNLKRAAPEISGQWKMLNIPGTQNDNGEINISTSASGSCSIILGDSKNKDAAWEFVKWWNSSETQGLFSKEIEAELSILGRYTPANINAFNQTNWYEDEKEILLKQWESVVEIPEVMGGYYVSRNIDNAFRAVYYNAENPRENLYYWMGMVNEELIRKQTQLNARKEVKDGGKN